MLAVGHLGSLDECIERARAERAALLDSVRVVSSKILNEGNRRDTEVSQYV